MSNIVSEAKALFSSKVEYRAVIRYLYLKGKTGKEIHGELPIFMGLLHHLMLRLSSGKRNSNEVERL